MLQLAGSIIAYQQKWTKEIISSVCLFGCCLIGANRTQEAAQTFNYLDLGKNVSVPTSSAG